MTKISDNPQIKRFLQGNKQLSLPFDLIGSSVAYVCTKALRLLPKKRLVLLANNGEQDVVIKLFSPAQKGQREFDNEMLGHKLAVQAGINVPHLLTSDKDLVGCFAIIYDYIANAEPFSLKNVGNKQEHVAKWIEMLANMHNHGIYQEDIHLDNILVANNELYLIDLGSVTCEKQGESLSKSTSLSNLALVYAQFFPLDQLEIRPLLAVYYQQRGWQLDKCEPDHFSVLLAKVWQKRKQIYLDKCFRNCTMTDYSQSLTRQTAFRANFLRDSSIDIVKDIEQLMASGQILKAGNSATVVKVDVDGKSLVIKRYNIKGLGHFLRRCFRPSRASVSWRNANLLEFIGLPTPKPLGFIETRIAGLRHTAYFISEYTEAEELSTVYQHRQPTKNELIQISTIFDLLQYCQISHGDLKASNFLIDNDGNISLIDLDAMKEHSNHSTFQHTFDKDKKRFLQNWQDGQTKQVFADVIGLVK